MNNVIYDRDYHNDKETREIRREILYEIANRHSLKINEEYLDYDSKNKEKQLKQMLQDIKEHKIENVLVYDLSRISRNMIKCIDTIKDFERNDVQCLIAQTGLRTISPEEKAIHEILLEVNKKIIKDIKDNYKEDVLDDEEMEF